MNILYFINGLGFSTNTGIGGSDKRAVEIIRQLQSQQSTTHCEVLTTQSGKNIFFTQEKLQVPYHTILQPAWWPSILNRYLIGRIISYFYATIISIAWSRKWKDTDVFFATSDFFFDVVPAVISAKLHKKKSVVMIHHYIRSPFDRKGYIFINSLLYAAQQLSFIIIARTCNFLFLYDTPEGVNISKRFRSFDKKHIYFVANGIDTVLIDASPQPTKQYDACFLGGIRASKGIYDFVPIWSKVVERLPKAKLLIIGGGSHEIVSQLKQQVEEHGLQNNIIFTGPLSGKKLYSAVKSAKLFLFPSYEEGWGIAVCEAMYCALPVLAYKLPAYRVFGSELNLFAPGSINQLAATVIAYLENSAQIKKTGERLKKFAARYTWYEIAKHEMNIFKTICS